MKRTLSVLLAFVLTFGALALAAGAATVSKNAAVYEVLSPKEIAFSYQGTECKAVPRKNSTLESLIDGKASKDVEGFDSDGVVLIQNVEFATRAAASKPAHQDVSEIPTFSFALDYGSAVTFDAVYVTVLHELSACIGGLMDSRVIVETSTDGRVWVPVGTDGRFYTQSRTAGMSKEFENVEKHCVDECVVALGETVSSRYVRLSFQFAQVPAEDYWNWYGDVYEWCGFTELGVAKYKSGRKADVITEEQATGERIAVEGTWVRQTDDETVEVTTFAKNHGAYDVTVGSCPLEQFRKTGLETETEEVSSGTYSLIGDQLLVVYADNTYDEYELELDGDGNLTLDGDTVLSRYDPAAWNETPGVSGTESSDLSDDSQAEESASSAAASSAENSSKAESAPKNDASSKAPSASASSSDAGGADGDGFPTWGIVLIVVAAVAVIAAVVIVIVRKKKA